MVITHKNQWMQSVAAQLSDRTMRLILKKSYKNQGHKLTIDPFSRKNLIIMGMLEKLTKSLTS